MLSIVGVLLRSLFNRGIEKAASAGGTGISVYAGIPLSGPARDQIKNPLKELSVTSRSQLLAVGNPTDLAIEAIRSLRTSAFRRAAQNNVLML